MAGGWVTVILYATAREAVGRSRISREVPPGGIPLRRLVNELGTEFRGLRRILAASRFVLNGEYTTSTDVAVRGGDEVAVHPPYSGG